MMREHWDITDRLGFTIGYVPDEFWGIDLNLGYSKLTGNIQFLVQLGAIELCLTYYIGLE